MQLQQQGLLNSFLLQSLICILLLLLNCERFQDHVFATVSHWVPSVLPHDYKSIFHALTLISYLCD